MILLFTNRILFRGASRDSVSRCSRRRDPYLSFEPPGCSNRLVWPEAMVSQLEELLLSNRKREAIERYRQINPTNLLDSAWHYVRLISTFGRMHSVRSAEIIFQDYLLKFPATAASFNALLDIYADEQCLEKTLRLKAKMQHLRVSKDFATYRLLIKTFVGSQRMDLAREVVDTMPFKPDGEIFSMLMSGFKDDPRHVRRMWRRMLASGLEPTAREFAALIRGLSKCKDIDSAENAFEAMEKVYAIERDNSVLAAMLDVYGETKNLPAVKSYMCMAKIYNLLENIKVLNALVRALARCGDWEAAELAMDTLRSSTGTRTDGSTLQELMQVHLRVGNLDRGSYYFRCISTATEDNYLRLIKAHVRYDDPDGAVRAFKNMVKSGMVPTTGTYNVITQGKLRSGDRSGARKWIRRMEAEKVVADQSTYRIIMDAYRESGQNIGLIEEALPRIFQRHSSPPTSFLFSLLNIFCASREPQYLEKRYRLMCSRGQIPAEVARLLIADAYGRSE